MPRAPSHPKIRPPACPRCGYDQTGVVATWDTSCPAASTCSECGLEFAWRDVLSPTHGRLGWLYEHGRGAALGRLVRSLLMAVVPVRFWRRVRMSHEINVRRLALMVVLPVVLLHLLAGINRIAAEAWYHKQTMTVWRVNPAVGGTPTSPSWSDVWRNVSADGDWGIVLNKAAIPVASFSFGESLAKSLDDALSIPSRWMILVHLWWAFMLLVLPDTRAIAKVRPAHVARAVAYPLALVLVLLYLGAGVAHWLEAWGHSRGRSQQGALAGIESVVVLISLVWTAWWWLEVCLRYLRLPRPILVWLVTGGVSLLGTMVFAVLIFVFLLANLRYG